MTKDFIPLLPNDVFLHKLSNYLNLTQLSQATLVSKTWQGLFSQKAIYLKKLKEELKISENELTTLAPHMADDDYKKLYYRYQRFSQKMAQSSAPKTLLKAQPFDVPNQRALLLALALDKPEYFFLLTDKALTEKEFKTVGQLALFSDSRNIAKACLHYIREKTEFLNFAALAGNLSFLKSMLATNFMVKIKDQTVPLNLEPSRVTMRNALKSGNENLIQYLETEHHLNPMHEKEWAAENGEIKMLYDLMKRASAAAASNEQPVVNSTFSQKKS